MTGRIVNALLPWVALLVCVIAAGIVISAWFGVLLAGAGAYVIGLTDHHGALEFLARVRELWEELTGPDEDEDQDELEDEDQEDERPTVAVPPPLQFNKNGGAP